MSVLVIYRKVLLRLLNKGYNPYSNNLELHQSFTSKNNVANNLNLPNKDLTKSEPISEKPKMTVQEGFNFGIKLKEKLVSPSTKRDYESKIKNFSRLLSINHPEIKFISQLNKKLAAAFLNDILNRNSART